MAVYIFINWFFPAYKAGGPVQTIANLVAQPEKGRSYKIVCSNKDLDGSIVPTEADRWLQYNQQTEIYYSSGKTPMALPSSKEDILFINGIYSWQYNLRPVLFAKAARKIVSARGMLHAGALSQKQLKKKVYLWLWKMARIHHKVAFHAVDGHEEAAIKQVFGQKVRIYQAANFPRYFTRQAVNRKEKNKLRLVSVALISPMKNIKLVLQALQGITDTIEYHLFGPIKDRSYWQECQALIKNMPGNITVRYHGDVPPDRVEEALTTGDVFILPSKSENFGHALYEALSAGKPVITSHDTPWNNLEAAEAGRNVSLLNEKELQAVIRFFAAMENDELEKWSRGASAYAQKAIDVEAIKAQYRLMFDVA